MSTCMQCWPPPLKLVNCWEHNPQELPTYVVTLRICILFVGSTAPEKLQIVNLHIVLATAKEKLIHVE